jgi:hypothetical protein
VQAVGHGRPERLEPQGGLQLADLVIRVIDEIAGGEDLLGAFIYSRGALAFSWNGFP